MSYGMVCLNCRRYVWHSDLGERHAHYCACEAPRPSLDARTEATPEQVERWWSRDRRFYDAF